MVARLSLLLLLLLGSLAAAEEEGDVSALSRGLADCRRADGPWGCLKAKAIELLDRADRLDALRLWEGLSLVRAAKAGFAAAPLPAVDPQATSDEELTHALLARASRFLSSHVVQVSLPKLDEQQLERSIEEGRGKMKKMMGHMMMMMGMKMMMFGVVGIAGLFLLAGKALIISKIALLLSGILALKKLLSQQQHGGHHEHHEVQHGWASGGGGGGGWGRRSFREQEAAQRLAYRAQRPATNDV